VDFTPVAVLVSLALDLGLNSLAEPIIAHIGIVILVTCLQVAMPLCTLCFIFVMMMRTALLQSGNFGALSSKFRSLTIMTPLRLVLLIAIKAYRIGEFSNNRPWALVWELEGYLPLFILEKIVMVFFYLSCYHTLLALGDPALYNQRAAPVQREPPNFLAPISHRQFRSVPEIIRGKSTADELNTAVRHLNELVIEKYQLMRTETTELHMLRVSEDALQLRKGWEAQEGPETLDVDCFTDSDLKLFPELAGQQGSDLLQVLKHLNMVSTLKTTRQYTLYSNSARGGEVQAWARQEALSLREATRAKGKGGGKPDTPGGRRMY